MPERRIDFSKHAANRLRERGTTKENVVRAIQEGMREPVKGDRWLYRLNLDFHREWCGKYYRVQQVAPVVVDRQDRLIVVTVYVFYF